MILEKITGSEYFPGGIGEFEISKNNFLVFEKGPSVDMKLQWAKYKDAADQCSLSRIWGGIHPYIDDLPGRRIGNSIAINAFEYGKSLFQESKIITKSIEKNLNNISVFPNPISSNNYLNIINESSNKIKEINIYNFLGRSELKYGLDINSNVNKLNLNELPNGIYLLKIIFDDNTSRTTKFVINR